MPLSFREKFGFSNPLIIVVVFSLFLGKFIHSIFFLGWRSSLYFHICAAEAALPLPNFDDCNRKILSVWT